jgi:hypothetical protein
MRCTCCTGYAQKAFRASPFPKSTLEPRFSMLMEEWETMRASNRESTRQWFKVRVLLHPRTAVSFPPCLSLTRHVNLALT